MDRDGVEYDVNPEDEREEPALLIESEDDEPVPPPTIDPDERIEAEPEDAVGLDDERLV